MSGGIISGHEVLTNSRNRKENLVISLDPSIMNRVGTAIRGLMSSNLLVSFSNALVVKVVGGTFLKPGSCSRGKWVLLLTYF